MHNLLLRNNLKLSVAVFITVLITVFITAAIASWSERIQFLWSPLMSEVIVVDANADHTRQAASSRIHGTVIGGLITVLVHTILASWMGSQDGDAWASCRPS